MKQSCISAIAKAWKAIWLVFQLRASQFKKKNLREPGTGAKKNNEVVRGLETKS